MATRKAKKKGTKTRGDSPITVGGGGGRRVGRGRTPFYMEVEFEHGDYIQDASGSFNNQDLLLDHVKVNDRPPQTKTVPHTEVPVREASKIVIKYKKGLTSTVVISGGPPLGVNFKTSPSHLPYEPTKKKHYGEGLKLTMVTIDGTEIDIRSAGNTNTIVAHTKDKPKRRKR